MGGKNVPGLVWVAGTGGLVPGHTNGEGLLVKIEMVNFEATELEESAAQASADWAQALVINNMLRIPTDKIIGKTVNKSSFFT